METYTVKFICKNCKWSGELQIKKGDTISEFAASTNCAKCGCVKLKEVGTENGRISVHEWQTDWRGVVGTSGATTIDPGFVPGTVTTISGNDIAVYNNSGRRSPF